MALCSKAEPPQPPPVVLYIAGSGRSGSTLLERALGAIPGFVNVGELIDLFRRVTVGAERCGCGRDFSGCPFWVGVGRRAFGGWTGDLAAELSLLQPKVARQRHLLRLLVPHPSPAFGEDTRRYRELYSRLYRAILEEADAQVVVDASKWPAQALALHSTDIDLRVIHLVRDVRGVAHSMSKDMARPHSATPGDAMVRSRPARASAMWTLAQTEIDLMRLKGVPVMRMRYEDLVRDPRGALETVLRDLGMSPRQRWFDHIRDDELDLRPSHGLSGNPSRFTSGRVPLHLDEAWRTQLASGSRAVITAIALPQLLVTGHLRLTAPGKGDLMQSPSLLEAERPAPFDGNGPLVSVVLPTRGRPELVRASIAAVVDQAYPGPIECLVVHDQEQPDDTLIELGTAQHQVKVLANTRRAGLAGARNTGLDVAAGEFIATCDDDDVWHPTKLDKQLELLRQEPDLLVVGSGIRLLFPGDRVVDWPGRAPRIELDTLLRNRVKELHSSTLVMRRDAFAKAGRYDEELPHGYGEDYDWILRAARVGKIGVVIEPLADIRKDVQSWFRERAENTAEALLYLLNAHPELKTSRRGHARVLGQVAYAQACLGQRSLALRTVGRSLWRYPAAPHAFLALAQVTTGLSPRLTLRLARVFRRGLS